MRRALVRMAGSLLFALYGLVLACAPAQAAVDYRFDFTVTTPAEEEIDFGFTLTYDDYVVTTGMNVLPVAQPTTPLGYPVAYAGTNVLGWWGFDDDGLAVMHDLFFSFGNPGLPFGLSAFLFQPDDSFGIDAYITSAGVYSGTGTGNALHGEGARLVTFSFAQLTVSERFDVPEPTTIMLLALGLAALAAVGRRRRCANAI